MSAHAWAHVYFMTPTGDLWFSCAGQGSFDVKGRSGNISPHGQHVGTCTFATVLRLVDIIYGTVFRRALSIVF
jgi:hypothetical protein